MDKTWKAIERRVASFLGGVRVPVSGRQRGHSPDVEHPLFSIEVKHRQSIPEWLFDAMDQAEQSRRDEQIPLVFLHQKGQTLHESLTVMRGGSILELQTRIQDLEERVEDLREQLRFYGGNS